MTQPNPIRAPGVVLWSGGLFVFLLFMTVGVWVCEGKIEHGDEHHLHDVMVDGLKVGLGGLIAVLSQWAAATFGRGPPGELDRAT